MPRMNLSLVEAAMVEQHRRERAHFNAGYNKALDDILTRYFTSEQEGAVVESSMVRSHDLILMRKV